MSTTLLDPRVIDASTLQPKLTSDVSLPVGVEGQAGAAGSAVVGTLYTINRVDEAAAYFDPTSTLYQIVKAILDRGAGPVKAVASAVGGAAPILSVRQAAWQKLEADIDVRVRLTDSEVQANLAGLAVSAANADLLYNKQIALTGMPLTTTKAALITAAGAIAAGGLNAATRTALIGPGVYDAGGTLRGGSFAAATVAAEIAKNPDPGTDLDLWNLPLVTGVELAADGRPFLQRQVVAGVAVDDYEDLLVGGVSPLQPTRVAGGAMTTHLRTVYTTNSSYDNLYTRIIVDQVFINVRDYLLAQNYLRLGNTERVRNRIKSGVEATLASMDTWISRVTQGDGTKGYNVSVTPSSDNRQVTIGYEGVVIRGINTIKVAANLSIPV